MSIEDIKVAQAALFEGDWDSAPSLDRPGWITISGPDGDEIMSVRGNPDLGVTAQEMVDALFVSVAALDTLAEFQRRKDLLSQALSDIETLLRVG